MALFRFKVEFEFMVEADDKDDAAMIAEDSHVYELMNRNLEPHCLGEVPCPSWLTKALLDSIPYDRDGGGILTCREILEDEGA